MDVPVLRKTAARALAALPLPAADPAQLRVVLYHCVGGPSADTVRPERFRAQLRWLRQHYRLLRLQDLHTALPPDASRPSALVTFDDGFLEQYTCALPILEEEQVPAVFFLASNYLGICDRPAWTSPPGRDCEFLSAAQARDLLARGHAIGSHSCSHPNLAQIPPLQLEDELALSRTRLEQLLGAAVPSFALPFGDAGAFNPTVLERIHVHYSVSFSAVRGANPLPQPNLCGLRRIAVRGYWNLRVFAAQMAGRFDFLAS